MDSRFRRLRTTISIAAGLFAVAGLSILSGFPKSVGACEHYLEQARRARDSGDNARVLHWAALGQSHCRADGIKKSWKLRLIGAEAQTALGEYAAALKALEPVLPETPEFGTLRAHRLLDQAWVHFRLAEYPSTEKLLQDAELAARTAKPPSPGTLSDIAFGRFYLYGQLGDVAATRQAMDQILNAGIPVDKAYLAAAYGWTLDRSAHFEEAAKYFASAIAESGAIKNPLEIGRFQNNLAGIYYHLGDLDQSLHAALQAEPALRNGSDSSGLRVCLNTAGLVYLDRGEYAKAEETLQQSLLLAERLREAAAQPEVLNNLTSVAIATGDWSRAEAFNRRAMEAENGHGWVESEQSSRVAQARILAGRNDFSGALAALDIVTKQPFTNPNPRVDAEVEYISIYRQLRDEPSARAHYRAALALIDTVRSKMLNQENKLAWYSSQIALHQEWVRFLIESDKAGEALQAAEWSRARLMLERLENHSPAPGHAETANAYQKLAREQNAVLISYWLMPHASYAWVIKPERVELVRLAGEQAIAPLVARYQAYLQDGNDPLNSGNTAAGELSRAILIPLLPAIGTASRVILVPDGQLHGLNFETLPVHGHYWIDTVTLSIAPSLNILLAGAPAERPRPNHSPSMLLIGDAEPTAEFHKLPSAAAEMASVARFFPQGTVLRGADATPATYLKAADRQSYIHFAAHASAVAERPLDSAVILSPDAAGKSDGRLTARDLLNQPSHAELVTISACRSAGVRSYRGEGPVGLAWVFLQSGAHGVVAGLWDANDAATADLMNGFYEHLAHGERAPDALRAAKLALLHTGSRFSRPYYWAPFQYYQGAGHTRRS